MQCGPLVGELELESAARLVGLVCENYVGQEGLAAHRGQAHAEKRARIPG
jgi:hypothetical protein